jgi:subtilisin-like proprotein convertase family protein
VDQFSKLAVNFILVALTAVGSVAPASAAVFFFENNSLITIPASGPANPYPSTINVSGVTGTVTKVVVGLRMNHTNPDDLDILLVNPTGLRSVMLMSDAGGTANIASGTTLTFDDCAPALLHNESQIVSGTYRPSNYSSSGVPDVLPAPAPPEPYGPGLAEFNGTQPAGVNGEWKLFVNDDAAGGSGGIGHWDITIFTDAGGLPGNANPVPCGKPDFDGDGRADISVYRDGTWFILRSSDGSNTSVPWGIASDIPVPADYDGDAITDIAVYRDGTWFIIRSSDGGVTILAWGIAGDIPVPADYDGDGKDDIAVYRNGTWFILNSSDLTLTAVGWGGLPQDKPLR